MTHLSSLLLFAVVRQRGEEDGREGGCLLGVILGGWDTILIFCVWEEKGERRRGGGEGEERGGEGEERGGEERGGDEDEEKTRSSHLMYVHGHIMLHMHLTGPLAFWSEFA